MIGLLVAYQGFTFVSSIDPKTLPQQVVVPADYPTSPSQPCRTAGLTLLIPSDIAYGQCWYGLFPCIPVCSTDFGLRGPNYQDGFRFKAPGPAN